MKLAAMGHDLFRLLTSVVGVDVCYRYWFSHGVPKAD